MGTTYAEKTCNTCKARKKKCGRELPQCSQCSRLFLECGYSSNSSFTSREASLKPYVESLIQLTQPTHLDSNKGEVMRELPDLRIASQWLESFAVRSFDFPDQVSLFDESMVAQCLDIITACNESIPGILKRYFAGVDVWLTFISEEWVQKQVQETQAHASLELALLLLCMHAVGSLPDQGSDQAAGTRRAYFAAKSLYNSLSTTAAPSLRVVQAGLLLSLYEYGLNMIDTAQVTISIGSRLALRLLVDQKGDASAGIENTELGLTCWGIKVLQICTTLDPSGGNIYLALAGPRMELHVPKDPGLKLERETTTGLDSCGTSGSLGPSTHKGPFCRAAEATLLLDEVLTYISRPKNHPELRSDLAVKLDKSLQSMALELLQQATHSWEECCAAVGLLLVALHILHKHVYEFADASSQKAVSSLAIQAITRMVIDIARRFNADRAFIDLFALPVPSMFCTYMAALMHIRFPDQSSTATAWIEDMECLKTTLSFFSKRWEIGNYYLLEITEATTHGVNSR